MALTPERIKEIDDLLESKGIQPPARNANYGQQRINELRARVRERQVTQATEGQQFETEPTSFLGKARDFATDIVGGGKLAEGAGMAFAAPKLQRELSEAEQDASDIDLALVKRIREKAEAGEDTSRLERAREDLLASMRITADVQEDFVDALPSTKEVVGSAARLAGTAIAPNLVGGVTKGGTARLAAKGAERAGGLSQLFGAEKAIGAGAGALRGAGAGATAGAVEGAIQGAGIAAEADKSAEEIIRSGILGGGLGTLTGGIVGAATGSIAGGVRSSRLKKEQFAEELVRTPLDKSERIKAITQGRLEDPTFLKKAEVQISTRDKKLADSIRDIVNPKATLGENIDAIKYKVDQTDTGVSEYIKTHKVPFNTSQLRSQLETGKQDLRLIFASDNTAERTYDAVTDAFMDTIGKKDTLGLFNARQDFDQIPAIKKLLQNDRLGENARKEIVLAVRRAANDYIANQLPKGNIYKAAMREQSYALEALTNLAVKSQNIVGKNKLQLLTQDYPLLKSIIGGLSAGLGLGAVGVGSSVIMSSD